MRKLFYIAVAVCISFSACPRSISAQDKTGTLLDEASRELTFFNFDTAYKLFTEVQGRTEPTGSPQWLQAMLGRALSAQNKTPATRQALDEAQQQYRSLIDSAPESLFAARATLQLGRIAEVRDFGGDVVDLEAARVFYLQVTEGWPADAIADEAALRYADTYFQRFGDPEAVAQGVDFLESWVEGRDDRPMASVIWEVIAMVKHEQLVDYAGALAAFLKADELGLAEPNVAGALYYRAAKLAEREVGDLDTAVQLYQKVIVEAPRSGRAFNAQLALEAIRESNPAMDIEIPQIKMFIEKKDDDRSDRNATDVRADS